MKWWWDPLCTRPTRLVGFLYIVLAHWNNSLRIDMSPRWHTLSWFLSTQFLLFLLNATCLTEKQHIPILYSLWFDPTRARTHDLPNSKRARLTITPPMRFDLKRIFRIEKICKYIWTKTNDYLIKYRIK